MIPYVRSDDLPPLERRLTVFGGRSLPILGSDERRTAAGLSFSYALPDRSLTGSGYDGWVKYEGFGISTRGRILGRTPDRDDRTEVYGVLLLGKVATRGPVGFFLEAGGGIAYTTQPIDDLPLQLNFPPMIGFGVRYRRAELGVRFMHISNADRKNPNNGLNLLTGTFGFSF